MGRTRMGHMDGRTDGQGDDYMLHRTFSGSIINQIDYSRGSGVICVKLADFLIMCYL